MKKKHPMRNLLWIPGILLIDAIVIGIAVYLDSTVIPAANAQGHPFPAVMIIAFVVMAIVTIIVILTAVVKTIKGTIEKYSEKEKQEE